MASVDGKSVYEGHLPQPTTNGFVGVGSSNFGLANYDNLVISPVGSS